MNVLSESSVRAPLTLLVNARAGPVHALTRSGFESRIQSAFARAGVEVRLQLLQPEALESALTAILRDPPELIFVGGGDGTLGTAARLLRGGRTSLAVLPLGTRNHFARELGVPLELEPAVAALLAGHDEAIDLAEINGRVFLNNVSIGIYPFAVERRAQYERELRVKRRLAMARACLDALIHLPRQHLRLRAGDHDEVLSTPLVFVGNNEYLLSPSDPVARARLDGGELCTFYMRATGRWRLLWTSLCALLARSGSSPQLEKLLTQSLRIDSERPVVELAIDGELAALQPPLEFSSLPRCLRVRRPGSVA